MTRVNRVTVYVGVEHGETSLITLCKNNQKLAEILNADIEVPNFSDSCTENKNTYQSYCKDLVINLLQNGGIEDFYYEEKEHTDDNEVRKYGTSTFKIAALNRLNEQLEAMLEGKGIGVVMNQYANEPEITERYKDGNVKFGYVDAVVNIEDEKRRMDITIRCEIKSGQICKPKKFELNNEEYPLNATSIARLLK